MINSEECIPNSHNNLTDAICLFLINKAMDKENISMEFTTNKEQKYYLRLKKKYRKELGREKECGFFNLERDTNGFFIDSSLESPNFQTRFTIRDLKKLHVDLSKFKIIKVEGLPDED